MKENLYDIWLSLHIFPGSTGYLRMLEKFGDAEKIYNASADELRSAGAGERLIFSLSDHGTSKAAEIAGFCGRYGVRLLIYGREGYPERLARIPDPPFMLYALGSLNDLDSGLYTAVVGSRDSGEYGTSAAYKISYELAAAGVRIVSGMARGTDAAAACGALEAGGKTIAVLGCGLDRAYPPEHRTLMKHIVENGCVISEYAPGSYPSSAHFPVRNRIISGLCQGTLVVRAGEKSGAVITAKEALSQGRRLYAVPGNVDDPGAYGSNQLIRDGAKMTVDASDILEDWKDLYSDHIDTDAFCRASLSSTYTPEALHRHGVGMKDGTYGTAGTASSHRGKPEAEAHRSENDVITTSDADDIRPAALPDDEKLRDFLALIPEGERVTPDWFAHLGIKPGDAMLMLSLLEITGYITGIPGGAYIRK